MARHMQIHCKLGGPQSVSTNEQFWPSLASCGGHTPQFHYINPLCLPLFTSHPNPSKISYSSPTHMEKKAPCTSSEEVEVRKGPWTMEEDVILINYIANHGEGVWNTLARSAGPCTSSSFMSLYMFVSSIYHATM